MQKSRRKQRALSAISQRVVDAVRDWLKEQGTAAAVDGGQIQHLFYSAERRAAQCGWPLEDSLKLVCSHPQAGGVMDRAYLHHLRTVETRRVALRAAAHSHGLSAAVPPPPTPTTTILPGRPFGPVPFGSFFSTPRWLAAFTAGRQPVVAAQCQPRLLLLPEPLPAAGPVRVQVRLEVPRTSPIRRSADVDLGWEVATPVTLTPTRTMRRTPRASMRYPEHQRAPASQTRCLSSELMELRCFSREQQARCVNVSLNLSLSLSLMLNGGKP